MGGKWTVEDGAELRAWRERMGLTQEDVVARTGLAPNTLVRLECAHVSSPQRRTLQALSALGAPVEVGQRWTPAAGRRLAAWLDAVGLTRADLTRALGTGHALVSQWTTGTARPSPNMRRMMESVGVPVAVLMSGGDAGEMLRRAATLGPLPADRTPASKRAALRALATDAVATRDDGVIARVAEALGISGGRLRAAARADVRRRHGVSMGVLIDEARQIREAHDASERRYNLKITDELLDVARAAVAHDDPTCLRKVASALGVYVGRVKYLARLEDAG